MAAQACFLLAGPHLDHPAEGGVVGVEKVDVREPVMAELVGVILQVVHIGGIGVDVPQLVVVLLGLGEGAAQLPEGDVVDLADQRAVPVAHIVHGAIKKVWELWASLSESPTKEPSVE